MEQRKRFRPIHWLGSTPKGNLALLIMLLAFLMLLPLLKGIYGNENPAVMILKIIQPIALVSIAMAIQLGSPLNWWRPFFGTTMEANIAKIALRELAGEKAEDIQNELQNWVGNMSKSRYYRLNSYSYKFLRKRDAAMFKLVWG